MTSNVLIETRWYMTYTNSNVSLNIGACMYTISQIPVSLLCVSGIAAIDMTRMMPRKLGTRRR